MPMTASLVILILILFLLVFIGNDFEFQPTRLNQHLGMKHFQIICKSLDFGVFMESLKKKGKKTYTTGM